MYKHTGHSNKWVSVAQSSYIDLKEKVQRYNISTKLFIMEVNSNARFVKIFH